MATDVFEMTIPTARRVEDRMRKIEETLDAISEMLKADQLATADLKLVKRILTSQL